MRILLRIMRMLQEQASVGRGSSHATRQQKKRDLNQPAPGLFHAASSGQ